MDNNVTFYKPNELIAVIEQVQVSRLAKHLCNYLLKYAQEQIKFNNHKGNQFVINIYEVNSLANVGSKDYNLIDNALKKLMQPVTVRERDNPNKIKHLVPIYEIDIDTANSNYTYRLAETMIELLRQTDYFTKLELSEFNDLDSKHSIVIFEILKRYENAKKIPLMTIDEFRDVTHTSATKTYDNFAQLKKWVIDVAINEINEKTQYNVSYEVFKTRTGRRPKISEIQFYFSKKKNQEENKSIDKNIQEEESKTLYKQVFLDQNSLYYEFIKFAPSLEKHVYIRSTYTYRESTLKAFLFSIQKNQNYLNSQTFMQWLEDRTNNRNIYKNYLRMTMPFNEKEVILKFKEASELVLKREFTQDEINQINKLLSYFGFFEYSVLVKKFETLFNQLVPTNSYNPFTKMIERNA